MPHDLAYDHGQGFRCVCAKGDNPFFTCEARNLILGTAAFVTGAFGLHCAALVVRALLDPSDPAPQAPQTPVCCPEDGSP